MDQVGGYRDRSVAVDALASALLETVWPLAGSPGTRHCLDVQCAVAAFSPDARIVADATCNRHAFRLAPRRSTARSPGTLFRGVFRHRLVRPSRDYRAPVLCTPTQESAGRFPAPSYSPLGYCRISFGACDVSADSQHQFSPQRTILLPPDDDPACSDVALLCLRLEEVLMALMSIYSQCIMFDNVLFCVIIV